jgi:hypothetical protein
MFRSRVECKLYSSPAGRSWPTADSCPTLPAFRPFAAAVILGPLLTAWTIRAALVCYVAYLGGWLTVRSARWPAAARWIWTMGCGLFLGHVACAFHFFHHWSHVAAWHDTAEQTQRLIGVAFGDGIYFSYLFLILWVFDVVWLWIVPLSAANIRGNSTKSAAYDATRVPVVAALTGQTPIWRLLVHVCLFFIAFNGAIVFKTGPIRWAGVVAVGALAALFGRWLYNSRNRLINPARELAHMESPWPPAGSPMDQQRAAVRGPGAES